DCETKLECIEIPTGNEDKSLEKLQQQWEMLENDINIFQGNYAQSHTVSEKVYMKQSAPEGEDDGGIPPQKDVIRKLDLAVSYLSKEKGFERMTAQLQQKAGRLKNNDYTIALFGAF